MARELGGAVRFDVPPEVVFDYLVDPRNRPEWQSSLRRVEAVTGGPALGQTWVDVIRARVRPQMRTDVLERPRLWSESGRWRSVRAALTLRFAAHGEAGCEVRFSFRVHALGPLGLAATALSVPAVAADLRRAARILSSRAPTAG
jgi:uncharacterized protein YndB with AHSA1/START domain